MINVADIGPVGFIDSPVHGRVGDYTNAFATAAGRAGRNGAIYVPVGKYYTASTIEIGDGQSLIGEHSASPVSHEGACQILGKQDLDPVVRVTNGGVVEKIFIDREADVAQNIASWRTGLLLSRCHYTRVRDVFCYRHGFGIFVKDSVGVTVEDSVFYGCHDCYVVLENAIQTTLRSCSLGRNPEGRVCPGILNPGNTGGCSIRIGGTTDTTTLDRIQFNCEGGGLFVDRGIFFFGLSPSDIAKGFNNGITYITNCHMDVVRHPFWIDNLTDARTNVRIVLASNSTLVGDGRYPFIGSMTGQQDRIQDWRLSNVYHEPQPLTPGQTLHIQGY